MHLFACDEALGDTLYTALHSAKVRVKMLSVGSCTKLIMISLAERRHTGTFTGGNVDGSCHSQTSCRASRVVSRIRIVC